MILVYRHTHNNKDIPIEHNTVFRLAIITRQIVWCVALLVWEKKWYMTKHVVIFSVILDGITHILQLQPMLQTNILWTTVKRKNERIVYWATKRALFLRQKCNMYTMARQYSHQIDKFKRGGQWKRITGSTKTNIDESCLDNVGLS